MPGYNEAETITEVVKSANYFGAPLVVDDGSSDGTAELAQAAGAQVVRLSANVGYEGAIEAGFEAADRAGFRFVITYDADGQFEADALRVVRDILLQGRSRLVLGQRPNPARVGEAMFNLYTRLRFGMTDILCGLKGYDLALYRWHGRFGSGRSVGTELALAALRSGEPVETISVSILPRRHGPSRFGGSLRANGRLLVALAEALLTDVIGRKRKKPA